MHSPRTLPQPSALAKCPTRLPEDRMRALVEWYAADVIRALRACESHPEDLEARSTVVVQMLPAIVRSAAEEFGVTESSDSDYIAREAAHFAVVRCPSDVLPRTSREALARMIDQELSDDLRKRTVGLPLEQPPAAQQRPKRRRAPFANVRATLRMCIGSA